ncbi:hypothetical protein K0M31_010718 [Melipona bicolor]|uniref:Uncharacterized protein n=1 Tax=Melipona bicolor TaxID=60889 RepID=A0AA40FKR8_9HYME|nr:hypothetical protein K0M31_010718 [Melipona bicolor]
MKLSSTSSAFDPNSTENRMCAEYREQKKFFYYEEIQIPITLGGGEQQISGNYREPEFSVRGCFPGWCALTEHKSATRGWKGKNRRSKPARGRPPARERSRTSVPRKPLVADKQLVRGLPS